VASPPTHRASALPRRAVDSAAQHPRLLVPCAPPGPDPIEPGHPISSNPKPARDPNLPPSPIPCRSCRRPRSPPDADTDAASPDAAIGSCTPTQPRWHPPPARPSPSSLSPPPGINIIAALRPLAPSQRPPNVHSRPDHGRTEPARVRGAHANARLFLLLWRHSRSRLLPPGLCLAAPGRLSGGPRRCVVPLAWHPLVVGYVPSSASDRSASDFLRASRPLPHFDYPPHASRS
jgi:hypothetical protein